MLTPILYLSILLWEWVHENTWIVYKSEIKHMETSPKSC